MAYVRRCFKANPNGVLLFTELRAVLGYDASNFRNRIRNHDSFKAGLEELGVMEIVHGNRHYRNAFSKK